MHAGPYFYVIVVLLAQIRNSKRFFDIQKQRFRKKENETLFVINCSNIFHLFIV